MTKEEIKAFIKDNLLIEVELVNQMSSGNDARVCLRFKDDDDYFAYDVIYIPECD